VLKEGTPAFMSKVPAMTNVKYAIQIERAVGKSVKGQFAEGDDIQRPDGSAHSKIGFSSGRTAASKCAHNWSMVVVPVRNSRKFAKAK
jgi:hypothetical protein